MFCRYNFAQYRTGKSVIARLDHLRKATEQYVPILTFKFFFAILPLLLLGYITGTLLIASAQGWPVNPVFILIAGVGIVVGIWDFKARYQNG